MKAGSINVWNIAPLFKGAVRRENLNEAQDFQVPSDASESRSFLMSEAHRQITSH